MQIEALSPANAVAAFQIFNTIKSLTLAQVPLPVAVSVSCTWPVAMSAAIRAYVGVRLPVLLKVPVPLVVYNTEA